MELTFPFKNMAINELLRLAEPNVMRDYIECTHDGDPNAGTTYKSDTELYRDALPNFENELLQVVNTSDQATIDAYFRMLYNEIGYIKNFMSEEAFKERIVAYNDRILKRFTETEEAATEEYFKSDKRKLQHLETYEEEDFSLLLGFRSMGKTVRTNTLIERVFMHPTATEEARASVQNLVAAAGLDKPVVFSQLSSQPYY
jgi:hypothetical protein